MVTASFGMFRQLSRPILSNFNTGIFAKACTSLARVTVKPNLAVKANTLPVGQGSSTKQIGAFSNQNFRHRINSQKTLPRFSKTAAAIIGLTGIGTIVLTDKEFEELDKKRGFGIHSTKNALVEKGIIKGATYYRFCPAGKTEVHDAALSLETIEVHYSPSADFWGFDPIQKKQVFLGKIRLSKFDKETLKSLDKLIDPQAKLPIIKKAVIAHCLKRGRYVRFLDGNGNEIASANYRGTIDIKSEKNDVNFRPHSLLQNLEEVEESKPPHWFFGLFGAKNTIEHLKYK